MEPLRDVRVLCFVSQATTAEATGAEATSAEATRAEAVSLALFGLGNFV